MPRTVVALLLASVMPGLAAVAFSAPSETHTVGGAIERAVRQRIGRDVTVTISELRTEVGDADGLIAVPDPGARTGRPAQFTIRVGTRRIGTAVARLDVSAPHLRARRAIDRGATIGADDVERVEGELKAVRLERLPNVEDLIKSQARRPIPAGEILTYAIVAAPHDIRAGDEVRVVIRVGPVEASGVGRASSSGRIGDTIRVTRAGTRVIHSARITAPGVVEILQ